MAGVGGKFPHHKVFGQIIFQTGRSRRWLAAPAAGLRWSGRRQTSCLRACAPPECRRRNLCSCRWPRAATRNWAGHRAVRAGGDAEAGVLKLGRNRFQQAGSDSDVAVAHHHQVIRGGGKHLLQAVDLGVGIGRLAGHQQARRNVRIFRGEDFSTIATAGSSWASHREQNFEGGIVLLEKSSQIGFEAEIESGERFENADRFGRASGLAAEPRGSAKRPRPTAASKRQRRPAEPAGR